jgi:hypothetical protein
MTRATLQICSQAHRFHVAIPVMKQFGYSITVPYVLWRSSLNILFMHRSVLLWRQKDNKSVIVCGKNPSKLWSQKMRQISLGINQSCSDRLSFHSFTVLLWKSKMILTPER